MRKSPKTQENTRVLKDKLIFFRIITAFLLILLISFPKITLANTDAEIAFWNSVEKMDTYAGYTAYLEQYPNGKFSKLAAIKIKSALSSETEKVTPRTKPASAADPAASETIPGIYNATFTWEKAKNNSYGGKPKIVCQTKIEINSDLVVNEKKISCPGWNGYTEWYYRGEFGKDGNSKRFKVNHAYGRGEYYLKGNTQGLRPTKISVSWWNLYIIMEKM